MRYAMDECTKHLEHEQPVNNDRYVRGIRVAGATDNGPKYVLHVVDTPYGAAVMTDAGMHLVRDGSYADPVPLPAKPLCSPFVRGGTIHFISDEGLHAASLQHPAEGFSTIALPVTLPRTVHAFSISGFNVFVISTSSIIVIDLSADAFHSIPFPDFVALSARFAGRLAFMAAPGNEFAVFDTTVGRFKSRRYRAPHVSTTDIRVSPMPVSSYWDLHTDRGVTLFLFDGSRLRAWRGRVESVAEGDPSFAGPVERVQAISFGGCPSCAVISRSGVRLCDFRDGALTVREDIEADGVAYLLPGWCAVYRDGSVGPLCRGERPHHSREHFCIAADGLKIWLLSRDRSVTVEPGHAPAETPSPVPRDARILFTGRMRCWSHAGSIMLQDAESGTIRSFPLPGPIHSSGICGGNLFFSDRHHVFVHTREGIPVSFIAGDVISNAEAVAYRPPLIIAAKGKELFWVKVPPDLNDLSMQGIGQDALVANSYLKGFAGSLPLDFVCRGLHFPPGEKHGIAWGHNSAALITIEKTYVFSLTETVRIHETITDAHVTPTRAYLATESGLWVYDIVKGMCFSERNVFFQKIENQVNNITFPSS